MARVRKPAISNLIDTDRLVHVHLDEHVTSVLREDNALRGRTGLYFAQLAYLPLLVLEKDECAAGIVPGCTFRQV